LFIVIQIFLPNFVHVIQTLPQRIIEETTISEPSILQESLSNESASAAPI